MRRFELIKGNKAQFWEILTWDDKVLVKSGNIGTDGKEKESSYADEAAAEVEFDRLIHDRRRKGYVEVDVPSEPPVDFEARGLVLRPLDNSPAETFSGEAVQYLLWRMVEVGIMDRQRPPEDLERWESRAAGNVELDAPPAPGDSQFQAYQKRFLEISKRDRAVKMKDDEVAAFAFRVGSHWIVPKAECAFIAAESANRAPKRKKTSAAQQAFVDQWCVFHERARKSGYEIVPV